MRKRTAPVTKVEESLNWPESEPCLSLTHDAHARAEAIETLNLWQSRKGPLVSAEKVLEQRQRTARAIARQLMTGKVAPRI